MSTSSERMSSPSATKSSSAEARTSSHSRSRLVLCPKKGTEGRNDKGTVHQWERALPPRAHCCRLVWLAQRLSGTRATGVVDATRRLLAVQAQDPRAARLALQVRTAQKRASAVDRALSEQRSLIST